ncbi:hypothetical protein [Donghicola mangrovi]|uniref:Uncharacterized protein n=1 Tax=Donghicola mangrovi TaxID=2729614 RepID=A0A850Q6A9_9RHOB|nr:hypothetical protein [Donghicola mangrovi]NVO23692.1 hypothetical protein [Donghicola mangrovi]
MNRFKAAWRRHPYVSLLFVVVLALTLAFGIRTVTKARDFWHAPIAQNQPLQEWMTPRYIAASWHIDKPDMFRIMQEVTGLDPMATGDGKPQPLDRIAVQADMPVQVLIDDLTAAILAHQSEKHD